mmetsp:Transcript_41040/g.73780  ORF Transcript_41040/g.73780 Transcript_41040/m.73780 type:complete len:238 (+) Transcript_41040:855-1568(+)
MDDAIGVDIEGHLNLRNTARGRRDPNQIELAQHLVVSSHFALTLQNLDADLSLIVSSSREHLRLLGGDSGVAVNETGEHAAHGLNSQAQWGNVKKQNVLHIATQHATLDGSSHGNHFIGVHTPVGVLAENIFHNAMHLRHASHATNQQNLADVVGRHACVLHAVAAWLLCTLEEGVHQVLKLRAGHGGAQMLGTRGVGGDERQVHVSLHSRGQLALGLLAGFTKTLHGQLVARKVDT